jgi:hypothetical protein
VVVRPQLGSLNTKVVAPRLKRAAVVSVVRAAIQLRVWALSVALAMAVLPVAAAVAS